MPEILPVIFVTDLKMADLLTESCSMNIIYLQHKVLSNLVSLYNLPYSHGGGVDV